MYCLETSKGVKNIKGDDSSIPLTTNKKTMDPMATVKPTSRSRTVFLRSQGTA